MTITMSQAAALLGLPKPAARRQRVCAECEGALVEMPEITASHPFGTGFDILVCEECDAEVERRRVGF